MGQVNMIQSLITNRMENISPNLLENLVSNRMKLTIDKCGDYTVELG